MGSKIKSVHARQLIDCKCRPLVEVDVVTECGALGRGAAPTGSSVGSHEAFVLRDDNPSIYHGRSVYKAVDNVNNIIAPKLIGMDVTDQAALDQIMIALDGSANPDTQRVFVWLDEFGSNVQILFDKNEKIVQISYAMTDRAE